MVKKIAFTIDTSAVREALGAEPVLSDVVQAKQTYGRFGAHRAYAIITSITVGGQRDYSAKAKKIAIAALEAAGARITAAHGCGGDKAIYLGYDNFEGGKYAARGAAIGRQLELLGINTYVDASGD